MTKVFFFFYHFHLIFAVFIDIHEYANKITCICDTPDKRPDPKLKSGTIFIGLGCIAAKILHDFISKSRRFPIFPYDFHLMSKVFVNIHEYAN